MAIAQQKINKKKNNYKTNKNKTKENNFFRLLYFTCIQAL